jgi:hypothetical protein
MSRKSGIIYETEKGEFGLAVNAEQHKSFEELNKVFIHLFVDPLCTKPKVDEKGNKIATLKSVDKIKMVGFSE